MTAACSHEGASGRQALLICGAARLHGVSSRYSEDLAQRLRAGGADVTLWHAAAHDVADCVGCAACRPRADERFAPGTLRKECVIEDDMRALYGLLDAADEVHLVCPVYFSGPTGRFKCVLDRLQPYWEWRIGPGARLDRACEVKRPAYLHVIGAGGDPFGYDALTAIVRSALGSSGFFVADVIDRIGWGQPCEESQKTCFS